MNYERVISAVISYPWAILEGKYNAIVSVLARREAGERFTEEQIASAVGTPRTVATPPYLVGEDGQVFRQRVHEDATGAVTVVSAYEAAAEAKAKTKMVAVLPVFGVIMPRAADFDMSETGTGIDQLRGQFRQALANQAVESIVLLFDSPGGSVYHVDEFAQEIFEAREQKRIVAQIDPLCASAAYWLASQAKEIVLTPSGEVGSIGVRSMHVDFSEALKQKGYKITHISAGKYKVEGNPHEPLSEEGLAFMTQRVNEYYDSFVSAVARGREVKASEVRGGFGEGRVVGAVEAKKLGMIDRIATFDETLGRLGVSAEKGRVAVGAAAVGGSSTTASAEKKQEVLIMSTAANPAAGAAESIAMVTAETERCGRIMQLAQTHGQLDKAAAWISGGNSVAQVQSEILATLSTNPVPAQAAETRRAAATVVVDEEDKLEKGAIFGRICRAYVATKGNPSQAALFARNVLKSPRTASMFEAAVDPQRAGDFASGGFLLKPNVSSEVIELLRPKSVVRSANPTLAPLVDGVLDLPKLTGGATATYVGETQKIPATKVTGGSVRAAAKTLATIVVISNKLLRSPSANADTIVRNDAIRAIAQAEDLAFLRSAGTVYTPKGLLFWKGTSSFSANGTVNLVNVTADLQKAITAVEEANADMTNLCWFMAPRTKGYLMQIRDGNGNYAFKDEMVRGTLMAIPFRSTSQIPKNLGGGSSSEVYLAGMSDVVIADAPQIAIEYTSEASIDDGSGNLAHLFQQDMSAIKVIEEHDLVVRHQESIVVIDTVNWV
jgi:HK97 family phage major capsid protein